MNICVYKYVYQIVFSYLSHNLAHIYYIYVRYYILILKNNILIF